MRLIVKSFFICVMLVACGGKDIRYRDTELLERPPTLATEKGAVDEPAVEPDVSAIPKNSRKVGLGNVVALVEGKPMMIKISQPYDEAWRNIGLALEQSEIKITDHNQKRGLYYVYYTAKSIFGLFSRKKDEQQEANFMVSVVSEDNQVKITAIAVSPSDADENEKNATSDQEALLLDLYESLHDHLKQE